MPDAKPVQPHLTRTDIPQYTAAIGQLGCGVTRATVRVIDNPRPELAVFDIVVGDDRHGQSAVRGSLTRNEAKCLMAALQAALMAG